MVLALNSSNLVLAPKTGGPLGLPATAAVCCGGKHLYLQQDEHLFKPAADCFNASEQKKKAVSDTTRSKQILSQLTT